MKTPDFTPVQLVALATAVLQVAVVFGVGITDAQQTALLALVGVLAATVLGDAHVRGKRADNASSIRGDQSES